MLGSVECACRNTDTQITPNFFRNRSGDIRGRASSEVDNGLWHSPSPARTRARAQFPPLATEDLLLTHILIFSFSSRVRPSRSETSESGQRRVGQSTSGRARTCLSLPFQCLTTCWFLKVGVSPGRSFRRTDTKRKGKTLMPLLPPCSTWTCGGVYIYVCVLSQTLALGEHPKRPKAS